MAEQPKRQGGRLKQDPAQALAEHFPWKPPEPPPEVIGVLKAVYAGEADAAQQRLAFDYILKLSYNGGAHYFPGEAGRRDTDFALGRAWVGQMLRTLVTVRTHKGGENG